jgi:uncharacterized protein (TIGR00290 family)
MGNSPLQRIIAMDYFCSWSGGRDSCLTLHRAAARWGPPRRLFTVLSEDDVHSRSHGIPRHLLAAQAAALGVSMAFGSATWEDYEAAFVDCLQQLSAEGLTAGVFGDIDLDEHRAWEEMVCGRAGMTAHLPLWREDHQALVSEFLAAGFEAVIVTVRLDAVPEDFLGEIITPALVARLTSLGVDVCGEGGEFHTMVTDGPLFGQPIPYTAQGVRRIPGYAALGLA